MVTGIHYDNGALFYHCNDVPTWYVVVVIVGLPHFYKVIANEQKIALIKSLDIVFLHVLHYIVN